MAESINNEYHEQIRNKYIRNNLIPYDRNIDTQVFEPFSKGIEIKDNEIPSYRLGEQEIQRTPILLQLSEPTPPIMPSVAPFIPPQVPKVEKQTPKETINENFENASECVNTTSCQRVNGIYITVIVILLIIIMFLTKQLLHYP